MGGLRVPRETRPHVVTGLVNRRGPASVARRYRPTTVAPSMERWSARKSLFGVSILSEDRRTGPVADAEEAPVRFEDFYQQSLDEVFRTLCVVLRDGDLAQEALDEAMTRAFERWTTVRTYQNPKGWVYRVASNWAKARLRKRRREVLADPEPRSWLDPIPDPDLDAALARLSLHHREVVVLRFLFDLTQDQIAGLLDIPVGTVKSRLHRALEALREEVSAHD